MNRKSKIILSAVVIVAVFVLMVSLFTKKSDTELALEKMLNTKINVDERMKQKILDGFDGANGK